MLLTLENICKISYAQIELNGITVIAGENNTGKSTLGRALFCIFNSFYKIDQQILMERENTIRSILENEIHSITKRFPGRLDIYNMASSILQKKDIYVNNAKLLLQDISEMYLREDENFNKHMDDALLMKMPERIIQILSISDEEIFKKVLQKKLESEFGGQISNIYHADESGTITLNIKGEDVEIVIRNNEVVRISNTFSLNTEAVYIDDPFVLDDLSSKSFFMTMYWHGNGYETHRDHLELKLIQKNSDSTVKEAINEIVANRKIDSILQKIDLVCSGEMVNTKRSSLGYQKKNSGEILNIKNISSGLKTFVIIKTLLQNGSLEDNGTIILDEPEIHLHPEWQLLFAELIVLLQKEIGMHILLNTHSPYFLNAIEVYAAKYDIADKCKYYLAENSGDKSSVTDVSDNIEEIYAKLARPLQNLENERYCND